MPTFHYIAKKGPQDAIEGDLEAESRAGVLAHLTSMGYTPVRITEEAGAPVVVKAADVKAAPIENLPARRVPSRKLNQFTRQFASLVRSQVPLLRALSILKDQTTHPVMRAIIERIGEDIRQGQTLSEALAKYPKVFSPLYLSLTRAGEVAGMLDQVLDRLAVQADREEALQSKIQGAMAYPILVALVGLGTIIFLMTFVMPRLVRLFAGFGERLPLPTRILLVLVDWFQNPWCWAAAGAIVVGVAVMLRLFGAQCRAFADRAVLTLPVFGELVRQLEIARFARSYGLLLDHGIPILQATDVAVPVVRNAVIRAALARLPVQLKEGGSVANCLKGMPMATPFFLHTVAVGEEAGRVGEALTQVADYYERELERMLQLASALMEPLMILVVGGTVGFIVFAVLLPIFEMSVIAR